MDPIFHRPSYYYALPTFPGYAGADWNYPLDQSFYTPNTGMTHRWGYAPDPTWQPDALQLTKNQQIQFVAGIVGLLGPTYGFAAWIMAGACPICVGAAFGFAIVGGLIFLFSRLY